MFNMLRLVTVCCLAVVVVGDVAHLFGRQKQFAVRKVSPPRPVAPANYQPGREAHYQVLRLDSDIGPDGSYQWAYETENGISGQETGQINQISRDLIAKSAQGSFGWTSPEGEPVQFTYVADENGYQPQGSHLPQPPPIPPAIQRALEWIAAHPQPKEPVLSNLPPRRF